MALNSKNKPMGLDIEGRLGSKDKPAYTHTHTDMIQKETRSKRKQILIKPSIELKVTAYADLNGSSFNDIVNTLLEGFVEENKL